MKIFLLYLLATFSTINLIAQKKKDYPNYLFLGADYSTNTQTYGVNINDVKQPNYYLSANYFSKYDFDISYSFISTKNADSTLQYFAFEHDFSIGYTLNLSGRFYLYANYTHLIHSKNSFSLKSLFTDIAQIDANYDAKYYNGYLTLNHIWGKNNMFYMTFQNAFKYEKEYLFITNDMLNIQICAALNFSDNNFYNELIFNDMSESELLDFMGEYSTSPDNSDGNLSNTGPNFPPNIDLKEWFYDHNKDLFSSDYTLTTIDFSIPVYYSIKNYMFSFTPFFSIPTSSTPFYEKYNSFQLMLGIGYFFEIK